MNQILRNLARRWANERMARANETLRRQLITAKAAAQRNEQTANFATKACDDTGRKLLQADAHNAELRDELKHKQTQIERQADLFEEYRAELDLVRRSLFAERVLSQILTEERDAARARVAELEQTTGGGLDGAWDDVSAAGLAGLADADRRPQ